MSFTNVFRHRGGPQNRFQDVNLSDSIISLARNVQSQIASSAGRSIWASFSYSRFPLAVHTAGEGWNFKQKKAQQICMRRRLGPKLRTSCKLQVSKELGCTRHICTSPYKSTNMPTTMVWLCEMSTLVMALKLYNYTIRVISQTWVGLKSHLQLYHHPSYPPRHEYHLDLHLVLSILQHNLPHFNTLQERI